MIPAVSLTKEACLSAENIKRRPKAFVENAGTGVAKTSWHQPVARVKVKFLEDPPSVSVSDIRPFKKRMLQKPSGR